MYLVTVWTLALTERRTAARDRRTLLPRTGGRRTTDPPEDVEALLARAAVEIAGAERLLDVAVIARRMQVSAMTVRNWIAKDRLSAVRTPGGHYRVPVSELARLLKSQTPQTPQI